MISFAMERDSFLQSRPQPEEFLKARQHCLDLSERKAQRQRSLWEGHQAGNSTTTFVLMRRRSDEIWDRSGALRQLADDLLHYQTFEELRRGLQYGIDTGLSEIARVDGRLAEGGRYDDGMNRIYRDCVSRRVRRTRAMMRLARKHLASV